MEEERNNYYRLAELFSTVVRPALSNLLKKLMEAKRVRHYEHTAKWWKANHSTCLTRAPPTGIEIIKVTKDPSDWPMNLLLKVIKYSNYDMLPRYRTLWAALNVLIKARRDVLKYKDAQSVPASRMEEFFRIVCNDGLSKFELQDDTMWKILQDQDALKTKETSEEEGEPYHKELLDEGNSWADFEGKLYERGAKPTLAQLQAFLGKDGKINVIVQVAPHYTSVGAFLFPQDATGAGVSGFNMSMAGNVIRTTEMMFSGWLEAEAGPSWEVLVRCLRDAQLNALASQIDKCLV